jgi:hypothetical protein
VCRSHAQLPHQRVLEHSEELVASESLNLRRMAASFKLYILDLRQIRPQSVSDHSTRIGAAGSMQH